MSQSLGGSAKGREPTSQVLTLSYTLTDNIRGNHSPLPALSNYNELSSDYIIVNECSDGINGLEIMITRTCRGKSDSGVIGTRCPKTEKRYYIIMPMSFQKTRAHPQRGAIESRPVTAGFPLA